MTHDPWGRLRVQDMRSAPSEFYIRLRFVAELLGRDRDPTNKRKEIYRNLYWFKHWLEKINAGKVE